MNQGKTSTERLVRLFRSGRDQVVSIPREFEMPGEKAIMRKEGSNLIISPAKPTSLLVVLARLKPIKCQLPKIKDQPPSRVKL